jgi:hypothetical protein
MRIIPFGEVNYFHLHKTFEKFLSVEEVTQVSIKPVRTTLPPFQRLL